MEHSDVTLERHILPVACALVACSVMGKAVAADDVTAGELIVEPPPSGVRYFDTPREVRRFATPFAL